jgi:hypothetical protein
MNERDKFLTEAMGLCWHEELEEYRLHDEIRMRCKCGETALKGYCCIRSSGFQQDCGFSTPDGFFKLWDWAQEQDWWTVGSPFWGGYTAYKSQGRFMIGDAFINPNHFADAVFKYLKERG